MIHASPDVSVVLCIRNGARSITAQLGALDKQVAAPPFEIVAVDNGSTDGTSDLLEDWLRKPSAAISKRVVSSGSRPSIPRARNVGALCARGRILAFCDADDIVHPGWVAAFARAVDADQLAGGELRAYSTDGTVDASVTQSGLFETNYLPHVGNANCAVNREVFLALGGYDESLPAYGFEDVDFSWRMQEAGHPIIYVPDAVADIATSADAAMVRKRFLVGKGLVLMRARNEQYDKRRSPDPSIASDAFSAGCALVRRAVLTGTVDRHETSRLVSAGGRASGKLAYAMGGVPARKLLTRYAAASPPRLAIAANNGAIGGGEVMQLHIAQALRELGIAVTVIGPAEPSGLIESAQELGFDTESLPGRSRAQYGASLTVWRMRNRAVPLWCNGMLPALATTGLGPRIVHLHQLPTGRSARALAVASAGARVVLAPSHFVARRVPGTRAFENWTGEFAFQQDSHREDRPVRIGMMGRITRDKGVVELLRAVHLLHEEGRDFQLLLAGENRFGTTADDAAFAQALEPVAALTQRRGWVDPAAFLAEIDVLAVPSRAPESFGLVVAEAMAAGVPVVVSDAGALTEVAGPKHRYVARAGDPEDLAKALRAALDELGTEKVHADRLEARERWEEHYSPAAGLRRVADLLTTLDGDMT